MFEGFSSNGLQIRIQRNFLRRIANSICQNSCRDPLWSIAVLRRSWCYGITHIWHYADRGVTQIWHYTDLALRRSCQYVDLAVRITSLTSTPCERALARQVLSFCLSLIPWMRGECFIFFRRFFTTSLFTPLICTT